MPVLSIVVPCFNEEPSVPLFYNAVEKLKDKLPNFEYVFVDDGSSDKTLSELKELAYQNKSVHFISFSRNFGKESAIYAGLKAAKGDYVVLMDADLQDPPELLPKMYEIITTKDYDVITTRRTTRTGEKEGLSFLSHSYYYIINKISNVHMSPDQRDYRMMTRQVVDEYLKLKEVSRFSKGLFAWEGFKQYELTFPNHERAAGESHWGIKKLFKYALTSITDFSEAPLKIATYLGGFFSLLAFIGIIVIIIRKIIDPTIAVMGWSSLACLILLMGGLNLLCIGVIGMYLEKVYQQAKNRPIYIARETDQYDPAKIKHLDKTAQSTNQANSENK